MKVWLSIVAAALSVSQWSSAENLSPEERLQWCSENLSGKTDWLTVHQFQKNWVTNTILDNFDLFVVLGIRPVQGEFDVLVRGISRGKINQSGQNPVVVDGKSLNIVRLSSRTLQACAGFRNWGKIRLAHEGDRLVLCDFELRPRNPKTR